MSLHEHFSNFVMPNIMMIFILSTFFKKDFIPSLHLYNSIK